MAATTSRRAVRWALAGGLAALVGLLPVVASPTVAEAAVVDGPAQAGASTWVDGSGRQVAVLRLGSGNTAPFVVLRDLPDGSPDASFGSYDGQPGRRLLALDPPAPDLVLDSLIVAGDGLLHASWRTAVCGDPCDRWSTRHQLDGTPVGTPVHPVVDTGEFPLPQDRGFVVEAVDDIAGRRLATFGDGTLVRVDAEGTIDLDLDLDCTRPLVGAAADGGFATTCRTGDGAASEITAARWDADGDLTWETTAAPSPVLQFPTHVVAQVDGRVAVGGHGGFDSSGAETDAAVRTFAASGPITVDYRRTTTAQDIDLGGIEAMVATADGVALVDRRACCFQRTYEEETNVVRLPGRPVCRLAAPTLAATDHQHLGASATTCLGSNRSPSLGDEQYRIDVSGPAGTATASTAPAPGAQVFGLALGPITGGRLAEVTVTPFNATGDSAAEPMVARTVLPFATTGAFVARQYADLGQGNPPATDQAARIDAGTLDPVDLVDGLLEPGTHAGSYTRSWRLQPVARLYQAYFLRNADPSGLTYWVPRYVPHKNLTKISDAFAASNEFRTRYGKLTDAAFVAELYRNVFDRDGDAAGLAFWTNRLRTGKVSRGGVVLQFSESSEGRRAAAPTVEPLAATWQLLGRVPTSSERTTWAAAPDTQRAAVADILASAEYAARAS